MLRAAQSKERIAIPSFHRTPFFRLPSNRLVPANPSDPVNPPGARRPSNHAPTMQSGAHLLRPVLLHASYKHLPLRLPRPPPESAIDRSFRRRASRFGERRKCLSFVLRRGFLCRFKDGRDVGDNRSNLRREFPPSHRPEADTNKFGRAVVPKSPFPLRLWRGGNGNGEDRLV